MSTVFAAPYGKGDDRNGEPLGVLEARNTLRKRMQADEDDVFKVIAEREAPAYVTWKQRNGTLIRVKDMDDLHLFNTIKMLERGAAKECERVSEREGRSLDPDEVAFDHTAEQFLKPIYHAMVKVAEARGIQL
jgi:hypothetical protein